MARSAESTTASFAKSESSARTVLIMSSRVRDDGAHGDLAARARCRRDGDERRAGFRGLAAPVVVARHAAVRDDGQRRLGGVHRAAAARGDEAVAAVSRQRNRAPRGCWCRKGSPRPDRRTESRYLKRLRGLSCTESSAPLDASPGSVTNIGFAIPRFFASSPILGGFPAAETDARAGCDLKRFHHEYTPSLLL